MTAQPGGLPSPGPAGRPPAIAPPPAAVLPAAAPAPGTEPPAATAQPPAPQAMPARPQRHRATPAAAAGMPARAGRSSGGGGSAPAAPVAGLPPDAPKLAISGGVYSTNPAQRMLIVNGQVFNEGSEIGPGVVLEQIKPKAAVLQIPQRELYGFLLTPAMRRRALLTRFAAGAGSCDTGAGRRSDCGVCCKAGGQVVLMRHAVTTPAVGDPDGMVLHDCRTQRNLSDEGRAHARQVGEAFRARGVPVAQLLSSPWCRCLETARLAFGVSPEVSHGIEQSLRPQRSARRAGRPLEGAGVEPAGIAAMW